MAHDPQMVRAKENQYRPSHAILVLSISASNQGSDDPTHAHSLAKCFAARIHTTLYIIKVQAKRSMWEHTEVVVYTCLNGEITNTRYVP